MTKALELIINIVLKHSHTLGALEEQQRDRNTDKGSKTSKREKGRETDRQKTYIEIVTFELQFKNEQPFENSAVKKSGGMDVKLPFHVKRLLSTQVKIMAHNNLTPPEISRVG